MDEDDHRPLHHAAAFGQEGEAVDIDEELHTADVDLHGRLPAVAAARRPQALP